MRLLALVVVGRAAVALAGPLAEVWPYQTKRLDASTLEYSYDLTALKQGGGTPDAKSENGEAAVAAFLKGLPREVKLKVKGGGLLYVSGARGIEQAPLATSFTTVPDGQLASDDPLRRRPASRMRPALDPDEPKLLPAAEMALWRARRIEDGALAAAALDTDRLLKAWLTQVFNAVVARANHADGDDRDGAILLGGRVAVALSCLDAAKLPAAPLMVNEARAQLDELSHDEKVPPPRSYWEWTPELQCAFKRWQLLGLSFPASRAGYSAGLVLLSLVKDPRLKTSWLKVRGRRDALFGGPAVEPLQEYLAKAGGDPDAALDDMMATIDRQGPTVPPVLASPRAPFGEFLNSLQGAERAQAIDELFAAVGEGRVKPPIETTASVEPLRQAALAAFALAEPPQGLQFDADWRDRLSGAFSALQGAGHEARESRLEASPREVLKSELKVVLQVPPSLEVEPLPEAFKRASDASARLAAVLTAEGLTAMTALDPEGLRGGVAVPELKRFASVLAGLAVISSRGAVETPDVANARRFLATWRADPVLARDVRFAAAHAVAYEGLRTHSVIAGVARRELAVQFAEAPTVEGAGGVAGLTFDTRAEQRYLVPVLYTVSYRAKVSEAPLKFAPLRKAIDAANREPLQIPGALQ
ncbi:MAG: hypothetical protein IPJ65_24675 [Archangiaceae bacterium]|nr:hypothetical protein [Archangiaceae bacterium]